MFETSFIIYNRIVAFEAANNKKVYLVFVYWYHRIMMVVNKLVALDLEQLAHFVLRNFIRFLLTFLLFNLAT